MRCHRARPLHGRLASPDPADGARFIQLPLEDSASPDLATRVGSEPMRCHRLKKEKEKNKGRIKVDTLARLLQ